MQKPKLTREYPVDGRHIHLLPREDGDVEQVGDRAEDAHDDRDVAVDLGVLRREAEVAHRVAAGLADSRARENRDFNLALAQLLMSEGQTVPRHR